MNIAAHRAGAAIGSNYKASHHRRQYSEYGLQHYIRTRIPLYDSTSRDPTTIHDRPTYTKYEH